MWRGSGRVETDVDVDVWAVVGGTTAPVRGRGSRLHAATGSYPEAEPAGPEGSGACSPGPAAHSGAGWSARPPPARVSPLARSKKRTPWGRTPIAGPTVPLTVVDYSRRFLYGLTIRGRPVDRSRFTELAVPPAAPPRHVPGASLCRTRQVVHTKRTGKSTREGRRSRLRRLLGHYETCF